MVELSPIAQQWLSTQPLGIVNQLIELAAGDSFVSVRIAKALAIPHPKIVKKIRGAPVSVTDSRLLELRSEGLTYAAIGELTGLGAAQVGNRLRKLKKEKSDRE